MPPLSNAQLESASQKLKKLEASLSDQPSARTGWDQHDLSGVTPISPTGTKDSKNKRPARQWQGMREDGQRPSSGSIKPAKPEDGHKSSGQKHKGICDSEDTSSDGAASASSGSSTAGLSRASLKDLCHSHQKNLRHSLKKGSRDDSFLSTISESTMSTDSTSTDLNPSKHESGQIDVYSESNPADKRHPSDVLKSFKQLFEQTGAKNAEHMQQLLHQESYDKPLAMQRRIIPVIMSAFQDEQKSFISVQGAPQSGKTSALALGVLGAVGVDMPGIRTVALSTGSMRDFRKCFDICGEAHPIRLSCFESAKRKVSFVGMDADPVAGVNLNEDMERLCLEQSPTAPGMIFGHPSRVLPLLRESPAWGIDLSNVQVLALDDAEEAICQGLMDEVCEICTILRHFSKQRLRHIMISHYLSNESKSMLRCLRMSLLKQNNLFGIQAHRTQARAKAVNHYFAVAPRARWPAILAVLHNALSLPSGIIFDDESADSRARTRVALRSLGITASVWNALAEQRSGARAAARDGQAGTPKGPAFHLMPSDLAVLKVDLPQVRCVLHFAVPKYELSVYGLRLMCLEQQDQKKSSKKAGMGSKSLSVLFVEESETVRELEKTFHIRMQEVPTDMLG